MAEERRRGRKRKRGSFRKGKSIPNGNAVEKNESSSATASSGPSQTETVSKSSSSSFMEKMKTKLSGGYFRMINEKLYTCSGDEALTYFEENPSLFDVYHSGYQEQMSRWPDQPVDIIIKWIKARSSSLSVADFGCGDARLAKSVKNKVFSIDLVSNDPSVIACDMSSTPLLSLSVDVTVFCLSLMGTNFPSYIHEANRVLKPGGWLLIAEVKSRFDPNTGGAGVVKFVNAICQLGFKLTSKVFSNQMFVLFYFQKRKNQEKNQDLNPMDIEWPELKPCRYKRR